MDEINKLLLSIKKDKIDPKKMRKYFGDIEKLNGLYKQNDTELVREFDDQLQHSLGMINFVYQKLNEKQGDERLDGINDRIKKFNEQFDEIAKGRYFRSENGYIEDNKNEPWKILGNVFSIFIDDKNKMDSIISSSEQYDNVVKNKLLEHLRKRLDEIETFKYYLEQFSLKIRNFIGLMKTVTNDKYQIEHVKIIHEDIKEMKRMTYDTQQELILGRESILLDIVPNTVESLIENLKRDSLIDENIQKILNVREKIIDTKMIDGFFHDTTIQEGGNKDLQQIMAQYDNSFNSVHKLLNEFHKILKEYEQLSIRYDNYFLFQMACILNLLEHKQEQYAYIDKSIIQKYSSILHRIMECFNNPNNIKSSKEKQIINYLNTVHYFSIKRMDKFVTFLSSMIQNDVIDVDHCVDEIYDSFIMFNQMKNILDTYPIE